MEASLRPVERADADVLLGMMREFYAIDGYPFAEETTRHGLDDLRAHPAFGGVWLIVAEGAVAGYLVLTFGFSFEFHGRNALVDELYLRDGYRGQGLGRQAMRFALDQCREQGIAAVHLEVEWHNTPARQLYESLGFRAHNRDLMTLRLDTVPSNAPM